MDLQAVTAAMIAYDAGDPMRIHHFLKVYAFAASSGCRRDSPPIFRKSQKSPLWCTTSASTVPRHFTAPAPENIRKNWVPRRLKHFCTH